MPPVAASALTASRLGRIVRGLGLAGTAAACLAGACLAVGLLALSGLDASASPLALWIGGLLIGALVPAATALLWRLAQLEQTNQRLASLLDDSGLDGPVARHRFSQDAEREWSRARRYGEDAALLVVEADHFKALSGEHGVAAGDAVVREIARVSESCLRQPDLLARHAMESLVIMLPHTDPLGALDAAERIRERVAGNRLPWKGIELGTTVSVGVASLGVSHHGLDSLKRDAEQALLAARLAGRNCVRAAPIQPRTRGEDRPVKSSR
jgi:diguanylate cyclase (GGDEF)-like protein